MPSRVVAGQLAWELCIDDPNEIRKGGQRLQAFLFFFSEQDVRELPASRFGLPAPETEPVVLSNMSRDRPQSPSRRFGEENKLFAPAALEPRSIGCSASSLAAVPADLFRIPVLILVVADSGHVPVGWFVKSWFQGHHTTGITLLITLWWGGVGWGYKIDRGF